MKIMYKINYTKKLSSQLWTLFFLNFRKWKFVFFPLGLALNIYFVSTSSNKFYIFFLGAFSILTILFILRYFIVKNQKLEKLKKIDNPEIEYTITDNSIKIKAEGSFGEIKWKQFDTLINTKKYLFLYSKTSGYLPIPTELIQQKDKDIIIKNVKNPPTK